MEPIRWTNQQQRQQLLKAAHCNLFLLPAEAVLIGLLTAAQCGREKEKNSANQA